MGIATRAEEQGPRVAGMRLGRVGARGRHAVFSNLRHGTEAATRAEEQGPRVAGMRLGRVGARGRHAVFSNLRYGTEAAIVEFGDGRCGS